MKSCNKHNLVIATIGAWWLSHIAGVFRAFPYACAAERDERNGLPYTAAMEWRKAAELTTNTRAAEYSWQQWERIMQLPRRLARPVGASQPANVPLKSASATRPTAIPGMDRLPFSNAA
jgi:hypothetical protein